MDDLINALIIKPNELIDLINFRDSLPDSILKDSIDLSLISFKKIIDKKKILFL